MRLSNLNKFSVLSVLFHFLLFSNLTAEQQIDLWKKDNKNVLNTNEEKNNVSSNLIIVVPLAIFCIGWVIKNSFFGL